MDQVPMQQPAQASGPTSGMSQKTILTIVIVVVGLAVLGWLGSRFFWGNVAERAIERAGGGDVDIDYNGDNTFTYEGEEGSFQAGEDVSLPSDWPGDVPVISGAKISYAGSNNPSTGAVGASVMFTTTKSVAEVNEYYRTELASQGWQVEGTAAMAGTTVLSAKKGERTVGLYIVGAEGTTTVTIGVSQQ